MADDQITVDIVAKVDDLKAGCDQARDALGRFVKTATDDLGSIKETSKESEGALASILSIEKFKLFAEGVKIAFEVVKEAFESTIGQAEEFGLSNAKFAAMMGTSEEQAAGLSAALRGVGSSAEAYEGMALKLEMRLRTNEGAMTALGIATRDHSGALLSGQKLMDSAIATMMEYKNGTDRNEYALSVFGRRASEIYDIMRVSTEGVQHQIDIYKELGVNVDGTSQSSQKLEEALNDLHTMFQALEIRIGQKLMPVVTRLLEWMGKDGKSFLAALADAFEDLAKRAVQGIKDIAEKLDLLVHPMERLTKAIGSLFNMEDSAAAAANAALGVGESADKAESKVSKLGAAWDKLAKSIDEGLSAGGKNDERNAIFGGGPGSEANVYDKEGGSKRFTGGGKKGGRTKEDRGPDEALKAAEKLALGEVALEESKNAHLLAMGKESDAEYIASKKFAADEEYNIKFAALTKELELTGRTKKEQQKTNEELIQLTQDYGAKKLKIEQEAEKQIQTQHRQAIANAQQEADERLQIGMAEYQSELAEGKITALEKANLEIQLTKSIRGEQLKRLDDELATLTQGTPAYAAVLTQRLALEKKFTADLKTEGGERIAAAKAEATQMVAPLASGFKTAISDMIAGNKTFLQSMQDTAKSMLDGFVSMCEQMLEQWVVTEVAKTMVSESEAVPKIAASAAVGGAGAASSQAGIPIVGPALAVAAGAAMIATILGYEALAHASGGMVVDQDRLVFAHKEEMVLPAHLSKGVQSMISSGGGGGGDTNFTYSPNVTGQTPDMRQLLRDQGGAMLEWIAQQQRDGRFRKG